MTKRNERILIITDRKSVRGDFLKQIQRLASLRPFGIILQEPDLSDTDYLFLAEDFLSLCRKYRTRGILSGHPLAISELEPAGIHAPVDKMAEWIESRTKNQPPEGCEGNCFAADLMVLAQRTTGERPSDSVNSAPLYPDPAPAENGNGIPASLPPSAAPVQIRSPGDLLCSGRSLLGTDVHSAKEIASACDLRCGYLIWSPADNPSPVKDPATSPEKRQDHPHAFPVSTTPIFVLHKEKQTESPSEIPVRAAEEYRSIRQSGAFGIAFQKAAMTSPDPEKLFSIVMSAETGTENDG